VKNNESFQIEYLIKVLLNEILTLPNPIFLAIFKLAIKIAGFQ